MLCIAVGRSGGTASVSYYIDGANPNATTKTYVPAFDTTGNSYIGRNSGSYKYQGFIDEFSIWNIQLSQANAKYAIQWWFSIRFIGDIYLVVSYKIGGEWETPRVQHHTLP